MTRLIDADALKERLKEYCIDGDEQAMQWYDIMGIDETIDTASTIDAVPATLEGTLGYLHKVGWMQEHDRIMTEDAVPVVRCEDCKYWIEIEHGTGTCKRLDNVLFWFGTDATDFCSFAERKDDE